MSEYLKRKNLLWEGSRFVLPEQKAAYLEHQANQNKLPPPLLDDQALMEIGMIVMDALQRKQEVTVVYWDDGTYKEINGVVDLVDHQLQHFKISTGSEYEYIHIKYLKTVERV
ncbi:YolD-like family protein [Alkalihalobacillus oceani]|uniref:YolD-like family protein n=1 Tax=Halalkalibacter oceani TaxID=1653776 RepID=UPI002040B400|nr:YolD-like family protein [Halalkalibacter oceani]MCM3762346.1 YolD-like family protein [Halalkalibacter oceani]